MPGKLVYRGGTGPPKHSIEGKYIREIDSILGGTDSILLTTRSSDMTLFYPPPYEQLSQFQPV